MINPKFFRPPLIVSLTIVLISISVLWTAYDYSGPSGSFPRHIGWVFLILAAIEMFSQFRQSWKIRQQSELDTSKTKQPSKLKKEFLSLAWLGALLLSLYFFGFMATIPVYVFAFLKIAGKLATGKAAIFSVGVSLLIYLLFFQLLEYQLFPGIFLGSH